MLVGIFLLRVYIIFIQTGIFLLKNYFEGRYVDRACEHDKEPFNQETRGTKKNKDKLLNSSPNNIHDTWNMLSNKDRNPKLSGVQFKNTTQLSIISLSLLDCLVNMRI